MMNPRFPRKWWILFIPGIIMLVPLFWIGVIQNIETRDLKRVLIHQSGTGNLGTIGLNPEMRMISLSPSQMSGRQILLAKTALLAKNWELAGSLINKLQGDQSIMIHWVGAFGGKLIEEKRYEDASRVLNYALSLQPESSKYWVYRYLGISYEQMGLDEKAEESYFLASGVTQDPELKSRVLWEIGAMYYQEKEYSQALAWFLATKETDPTYIWGNVGLGDTYTKLGMISEARIAYESALMLDPEREEILEAIKKLDE